jgi:RimJ/RimL family protein N-acetyltransferase
MSCRSPTVLFGHFMPPVDDTRACFAHDGEHARRTVRAIREALARVPFYLRQGLTVPSEESELGATLAGLPLLTAAKIRPTLPKAWLPEGRDAKAELASGKLAIVETGLAEARVRLLWDGAWWRAQEERALQVSAKAAAALAGEQGPYRDAVLWVPERGTGSCGSGDPEYDDRLEGSRLHLNSRQDPTFWSESVMTRMLDELTRHETTALLADPFYLDVLARHAATLGRALDVRGFVGLTRGLTTAAHREALARVFPAASTLQIYGAREAGLLFVQGEDDLLHHAPFGTHVELLRAKVPTPGATDVALVVVTTLDREVQPLVRYVLGDLVQVSSAPSRFTTVSPLVSVEGKLDDALVRPDGALVTPGAIDRAIAAASPRAYQVVQTDPGSVTVEVIGASAEAASAALSPLLEGMTVTARLATAIAVEPNGKYRISRRTAPATTYDLFEGAER